VIEMLLPHKIVGSRFDMVSEFVGHLVLHPPAVENVFEE
jgi:hypothetical protein